MPDIAIYKQIEHDPELRRWSGVFFKPKRGVHYKIPENSANHRDRLGQCGICRAVRSSLFGMHWAKIEFCDSHDREWIRTKYIVSTDGV